MFMSAPTILAQFPFHQFSVDVLRVALSARSSRQFKSTTPPQWVSVCGSVEDTWRIDTGSEDVADVAGAEMHIGGQIARLSLQRPRRLSSTPAMRDSMLTVTVYRSRQAPRVLGAPKGIYLTTEQRIKNLRV